MKIHLYLPGNGLHSNLLPKQYKNFNQALGGLQIIADSGLPVSVSFQEIDDYLYPWLPEFRDRNYVNIEWCSAPFSHALMPLQPGAVQRWLFKRQRAVKGIGVDFFAEFYAPSDNLIANKYFWVSWSQNYLYSFDFDQANLETQIFGDAPAIRFGDKIGIVLKEEGEAIVRLFFAFQLDPSEIKLNALLDEIARIGNLPDGICPIVIDLEAPFIGSSMKRGQRVWEIFLQGLASRKLMEVFTPISPWLNHFAEIAVPSKQPHRILTKWMSHQVQLNYNNSMMRFEPLFEREFALYAIANGSDIYSAWDSRIKASKKPTLLRGRCKNGRPTKIEISFNQEVIGIQMLARKALRDFSSYAKLIKETSPNLSDKQSLTYNMYRLANQFNL